MGKGDLKIRIGNDEIIIPYSDDVVVDFEYKGKRIKMIAKGYIHLHSEAWKKKVNPLTKKNVFDQ